MSPTTLVTFRVRAPRTTRILELYGSWDNFAMPYAMSKDLQIGSEYWSGCFNFSNIICDGRPGDVMASRDGGLKMGGTYWYYYKADFDVDFHNVCERATNNCPLMPGQLVNVLHVPFAMSEKRSRNHSADSTSSERRTMNPEDRFINPRPAPAKPVTLRVKTSPIINDFSDTDSAATKETPNASRFLRLPKKASVDSQTSSPSSALTGGLRAAFKIRTARSQSPGCSAENGHYRAVSAERDTGKNRNQAEPERFKIPARGLLLRSTSEESVPTLSFEQHRQQRSRLREASSSENTSPVCSRPQVESLNLVKSSQVPLGTFSEAVSAKITPIDEESETAAIAKMSIDLQKRLPTLPNTPSSAYPPITTIDTDADLERSHFSAWTTTTNAPSVFINSSVPLPLPRNPAPCNPAKIDAPQITGFLPSFDSLASMSSSTSSTPSISFFDIDTEFENAQNPTKHQPPQYSLPEDDYKSPIISKPTFESFRGRAGNPAIMNTEQHSSVNSDHAEIVHSESMQRLLAELSYLSDMIQH
ncbi:hypothetical protein LTR05_008617 [Lithohypha guttulata]|uniref:Uncharacterized protein n=1 Tax=Lithohypha guttulata TaxID=1690604 RepID=A0AAN7SEM4_9EURO|nr:hypothetical protein LTR05_008617 [Lithohypha guttulata]